MAEDTFGGKNSLTGILVFQEPDIHRAISFTNATVITFFGVNFHPPEGKTLSSARPAPDKMFAEGALIFQCGSQPSPNQIRSTTPRENPKWTYRTAPQPRNRLFLGLRQGSRSRTIAVQQAQPHQPRRLLSDRVNFMPAPVLLPALPPRCDF